MDVKIYNCNNIDQGAIKIDAGRLNIKYALNGTGKTTISKALLFGLPNNEQHNKLVSLKPFKHVGNEDAVNLPSIKGLDNVNNVEIFNEDYINQYVYLQDELVKNSFEIFIKTSDYEKHMSEIETLINNIKEMFRNNPELNELLDKLNVFVEGFGKAKSGYSSAGSIGKGLGKGNKIINIPDGLEDYKEYLQNDQNVQWLKWQMSGGQYLDIAEKCPYCTSDVIEKREKILKISEEYDAKSIEQLNKMIELLQWLNNYFSEETKEKINLITKNISGIAKEQIAYLKEIKEQVDVLREKLGSIKHLGFNSLKDVDKVVDTLKSYKIDLSYLSHLNSDYTNEKISLINISLDDILAKAGKLQGEINKQNKNIEKTIKQYSEEINSFLKYAGYQYCVTIEQDEQNLYKMKLKHNDVPSIVESVKNHLSFGEKNAFALVLFMYGALKNNPDLIILDDPISSFDENKKFAILNMLFMGKTCLRDKTVLMLTHDFNPVIDAIYNMPYNFNPAPKAAFLINRIGILTEKEIKKSNICTFYDIAGKNIQELDENVNKLVYLRRLFEVKHSKGNGWQLLSNLFHKREIPIIKLGDTESERNMNSDEIGKAMIEIQQYINDFDYNTEYQKISDNKLMIKLYKESTNNYEKLQIYRVINNENNENGVIKKFVNEIFHIENDYLFQLNPCEYEIIPQYIIEECDKDIVEIEASS